MVLIYCRESKNIITIELSIVAAVVVAILVVVIVVVVASLPV